MILAPTLFAYWFILPTGHPQATEAPRRVMKVAPVRGVADVYTGSCLLDSPSPPPPNFLRPPVGHDTGSHVSADPESKLRNLKSARVPGHFT